MSLYGIQRSGDSTVNALYSLSREQRTKISEISVSAVYDASELCLTLKNGSANVRSSSVICTVIETIAFNATSYSCTKFAGRDNLDTGIWARMMHSSTLVARQMMMLERTEMRLSRSGAKYDPAASDTALDM